MDLQWHTEQVFSKLKTLGPSRLNQMIICQMSCRWGLTREVCSQMTIFINFLTEYLKTRENNFNTQFDEGSGRKIITPTESESDKPRESFDGELLRLYRERKDGIPKKIKNKENVSGLNKNGKGVQIALAKHNVGGSCGGSFPTVSV